MSFKKTSKSRHRLWNLSLAVAGLSVAFGCLLGALREGIVFYVTPTEVHQKTFSRGHRLRVGGLVVLGSVFYEGNKVSFKITDAHHTLELNYQGVLPDLFREGQGVVAEGVWQGTFPFIVDTVFAKHDETYKPPTLDASLAVLKKKGYFRADQ